MKRKVNSKIILVFSALFVCVTFVVIWLYYPRTGFEMKPDSDKGTYISNESGYFSDDFNKNDYLQYSNGQLIAKDFGHTKATIFSGNGAKSISVPKSLYQADNKMIYIKSNKLYVKNTETDVETFIDDNCSLFCVSGDKIAYQKDSSVFIANINTPEKKLKIADIEYKIEHLCIEENVLYLIERNIGDCYFYSYSIDDSTQLSSFEYSMSSPINGTCLDDGYYYYYYEDTQTVIRTDMATGAFEGVVTHPDIIDMCVNGDKLYFISEQTEGEIVTTTVECEDNGIWEVDIPTGESRKLSDKCVFNDLLATDNYVYCYKIDYLLPRGMANSWVKGYEIEQISIQK